MESNINIPESYELIFQQLQINTLEFEKNIKFRTKDDIHLELTSNDCSKIMTDTEICNANWIFLGTYGKKDNKYFWRWPWSIEDNKISRFLKNKYEWSKAEYIEFDNAIMISYIFSELMKDLNLDYIYITNPDNFNAIGLFKTNWVQPINNELKTEYMSQFKETDLADFLANMDFDLDKEPEKKEAINWSSFFNTFKSIYKK